MRAIYKLVPIIYNCLDIFYLRKNNQNHRDIVLSQLPKGNCKILDMCTGTATNAIAIAEYNARANIFGIDISNDMLNLAMKTKMKKTKKFLEREAT